MSRFDYIIAGGGAAGLSLAYHMGLAGLTDRRILLIDQDAKTQNDRTWCFWEIGAGPFEPAVFRSWDHLWFHSDQRSARLSIAPYRYKLLQGIDFYRFVHAWIDSQPQITRLYGRVEGFKERSDGVDVMVDGKAYGGSWVFNSIYRPQPTPPGYHAWLQHFKGWVIRTPVAVFDTGAATFMDFRIEQGNEVRFGYVLPFDTQTALVEYTFFSPQLEAQEVYDNGLKAYIREQLGIAEYAVLHREFGVIPMTDAPFVLRPGPHMMNIGTAGGMTKASTGYTFQRIQQQSRRIVEQLRRTGRPFYPQPPLNRHALMDSVLLNVLDEGRESGHAFFNRLFIRNSPQRVLRFLDEQTGLLEDLAIMSTVNIPQFTLATIAVAAQRLSPRALKHERT